MSCRYFVVTVWPVVQLLISAPTSPFDVFFASSPVERWLTVTSDKNPDYTYVAVNVIVKITVRLFPDNAFNLINLIELKFNLIVEYIGIFSNKIFLRDLVLETQQWLSIYLKNFQYLTWLYHNIPYRMLHLAFSCFWCGPLYSSCGCCEAWCVFGWKQWMHHVEWIFASLQAWWTIITQTRFCSRGISIMTLSCPHCIWLCHPALQAVLWSAFKALMAGWSCYAFWWITVSALQT